MANIREIKGRIKSVKNIQQITKAMQMVAAAKVRRAQERVLSARPYAEQMEAVFKQVAAHLSGEDIDEPLLKVRPVKRVGLVIVSSDKGLAGSFNANVLRASLARAKALREAGTEPKLWLVGNKAIGLFKRFDFDVGKTYSQLPAIPTAAEARLIVSSVIEAFKAGEVDRVEVIYTRFASMLSFKVTEMPLLPIAAPQAGEQPVGPQPQYLFEPSAAQVISAVLPKYADTLVYRALLESAASELASRMMAMSSATKNASEMLSRMTLAYNKARQASITQEILEVVGGAEAMKG